MVVWGGAGVPVTKGDCGKVWSCRWGLDLLDAPRTSQNGVIKIHPRACRTSILSELDMHFYSILLFFCFISRLCMSRVVAANLRSMILITFPNELPTIMTPVSSA